MSLAVKPDTRSPLTVPRWLVFYGGLRGWA